MKKEKLEFSILGFTFKRGGQRDNFRSRVVRLAPDAPFSIHYSDL